MMAGGSPGRVGPTLLQPGGIVAAALQEHDKSIPVIVRLRMEERAKLSDLQNLFVYSSQGTEKVSLRRIASLTTGMRPEKIVRRNQFRTITVGAFPRLCHAQIGGLAMATVITLLLVPVFYSIAVLDLKIIKWAPAQH